ncbi:MAG: hypothetical protein O9308_14925 [Beijerinckiaceae bacterium]|nr:hypothetical protein [Beijerinckiaceae bacterium]
MDMEMRRNLAMQRAWEDLSNVGKSKAVGHLPISLIKNGFKYSFEEVRALIDRECEVYFLEKQPSCLVNGGVFVISRPMFLAVINREQNRKIIRGLRWKVDVDYVLGKISRRWFPPGHRAVPLIRELYGDDGQ